VEKVAEQLLGVAIEIGVRRVEERATGVGVARQDAGSAMCR